MYRSMVTRFNASCFELQLRLARYPVREEFSVSVWDWCQTSIMRNLGIYWFVAIFPLGLEQWIATLFRSSVRSSVWEAICYITVVTTPMELIYLHFPPSSHLKYVCFCPVGLSLLWQHYQQVLWALKFLLCYFSVKTWYLKVLTPMEVSNGRGISCWLRINPLVSCR